MEDVSVDIQRPDRWDHPLSEDMSPKQVAWLLEQSPFKDMDRERFARTTPLVDILRNDARILDLQSGDVIFREGQYGGSAYLVLKGSVRISLSKLWATEEASRRGRGNRWLSFLKSKWRSVSRKQEARKRPRRVAATDSSVAQSAAGAPGVAYRGSGANARIFLQDVPGVLDQHETGVVTAGELFGEMAAVSRSPREFTAFADARTSVLEVRWQGLKLLKQDPAFRRLLDERYRAEVLKNHLRETDLFRYLPEENLDRVAASVRLESFGSLEWFGEYKKRQGKGTSIEAEPMIAQEGSYATGLWIIRGGFARLSRRQGAGHRTLAYLGKGQIFGLNEVVHNALQASQAAPPLPFQESLRAIGYVDALCVPKQIVVECVLPFVRQADLPGLMEEPRYQFGQPVIDPPLDTADYGVETGLLEFLVDERLINGRKAMVIDTDRCTRCDDCVRACARMHSGQPVFVREGPQYGPWMFAQACMHCEDPVCMIGCPTGAIHRDLVSGLVDINDSTCIGCKSCAESCPYDNIRMVDALDEQGRAKRDVNTGLPILQASKCDFCASSRGAPACQSACPHDALVRLDMSDLAELGRSLQRKAG